MRPRRQRQKARLARAVAADVAAEVVVGGGPQTTPPSPLKQSSLRGRTRGDQWRR